jgi:alcohol/geraniol dehydrogenase (NADP+)
MAQIQGLAAHAAGAELLPFRYDPGELGMHEVEIGITHCGICHSDIHLISNDWGMSQYPFIPGHEIIGTVTAVGSQVGSLKAGERVGLGWQSNSCGVCEWCTRGLENLCPQSEGTCVHRHGGYANRVRGNVRFVVKIPDALPSEQAAPLLCGGITVYNPMRDHAINPSSRVGVVGIGGLGHLAIQFARVFGAEVTAFSTSAAKEEEARALGAHRFVNTRESKAMKEVAGSYDFILNTANADQDWGVYIQALRPTGTLCFVGVPPSPVSLQAFPLIAGIRTVTGSPIGSPHRLREMLDVAARHGVKATTEGFPMAKANEAIEKVKKNKVRYRAVLAN